jgi:hypothetical protein
MNPYFRQVENDDDEINPVSPEIVEVVEETPETPLEQSIIAPPHIEQETINMSCDNILKSVLIVAGIYIAIKLIS